MAVRGGHKEELDDFDKRLEELRRRFELFFQGSKEQRIPPTAPQAQLGSELRRKREDEVRTWSTQDKFRFNEIFARFLSLDCTWARTMKQIEEGTYKRDKFKVGRKKQQEQSLPATLGKAAAPVSQLEEQDLDVDVTSFEDGPLAPPWPAPVRKAPVAGLAPPEGVAAARATASALAAPSPQGARPSDAGASRAASPPAAPRAAQPAASAASGDSSSTGMSEQRLQQLYDVYIQAKRRMGESSSLTVDVLRKQIEKQIPAIKAKHKCEQVDFKVVLKDGKAILKAIPR